MDFNLTDEQQMLRESASRFVREQYGFEARRKWTADAGWSSERWGQYAEMGWLSLSIPEEMGGLGCSFVETALVAEELGRGMVLEPFIGCAVLAARLAERGDAPGFAARREALLAGIADGSAIALLAHSEPGSRFELDAVATQARETPGGWVIDGTKMMVPGAPGATHFIVSANVQGQGVALFLLHREAVVLQSYALIDGTRAADIELHSVAVGKDALLANPGSALPLLEEAMDRAALAQVAEGLGCMEAVLALTAEYLKTRQQFGQPIGKFQALQHRMSEMFVEVQETRSILLRGIAHLEGEPAARKQAVSAAKVMLGTAGRFVGGQGIQLHGGIGVTDEYQVGHYYKRLLALEKIYGDSDWHLDRFIAAQREAA
ncbi:acyl-CoA dehydrogenase family protein [Ramlibacter sp. WS9]|uniref:acyl-CoA dehydrogenase family protein n=1 Tax=Ramlibacter sp. WS9 TaxID=1882741 RepID=UPI001142261F|nr:acyl-CoA dehydrogenase family protein [Ramlibacter sp. WS9]ROZ69221.1 acyl-CoA dehydrogenase [Ramlibacter sp. WS9]